MVCDHPPIKEYLFIRAYQPIKEYILDRDYSPKNYYIFVQDHPPKCEYILIRVHAILQYFLFIILESCELVVVMLTYLN